MKKWLLLLIFGHTPESYFKKYPTARLFTNSEGNTYLNIKLLMTEKLAALNK